MSRRTTNKKVRQAATLDLDTARVAVYLRRSADDESQPYSIAAQDAGLNAYLASQPGWEIVKEFQIETQPFRGSILV